MATNPALAVLRATAATAVVWLAFPLGTAALAADPAVEFLRDVKPILALRCYRCHSSLEEESGLRLDSVPAILKGGEGGAIVVPGKSSQSRLVEAIVGAGDLKMPPEGEPLTESQIAVIRAWIDAGAPAPPEGADVQVDHWSFRKPERPALPTAVNAEWSVNPIDAFVAAKHAELGLTPVGEAPQNLLLRRLYLDLIGVPPTPEQLEAVSYEVVVDDLLASPQYGERWGRHWMDVWRYSDWDGYGKEVRESQPHIWRWRDWIVESLNADKPYDRMVQEMLAADELLPRDEDALRATGYLVRSWYKFNRNKWMDDVVEHTGKAFLGVTFNCARCHDHMYDPLSQREYYALRAFFEPYDVRIDRLPGESDTTKQGLARVFDAKPEAPTFLFVRGNEKEPQKDDPLSPAVPGVLGDVPCHISPVQLQPADFYPGLAGFIQEEMRAAARQAVDAAKAELKSTEARLAEARKRQTEFLVHGNERSSASQPADERHEFHGDFQARDEEVWSYGPGTWEYADGKLIQRDPRDEPCGITLRRPHPRDFIASFRYKLTGGDVYQSVGIAFDAVEYRDYQAVYLSGHSPGPHRWARLAGADSYPPSAPKATAAKVGEEYELKLAVRGKLANVWVNGSLVQAFPLETRPADGRLIFWTYDAMAEFLSVTVDPLPKDYALVEKLEGTPLPAPALSAEIVAAAVADAERQTAIGAKAVEVAEAFRTALEARIMADTANYAAPPAASAKELALAASAAERRHAALAAEAAHQRAELALVQSKRMPAGDEKAQKALQAAEEAEKKAKQDLESAQKAAGEASESYSRLTTVYPTTSTGRRLALAKWITSRDNPLAARVAINHIWLRHFGTPLVPTVFDFGLNGKPPTNQALLDWLAVELMENGWRMKPIHRLIVTSRTYRLSSGFSVQGSKSSSQALNAEPRTLNTSIDPENLYYWRANPRRMEGEIVRDATLHVAGSLDKQLGGPELDHAAGLTIPRRTLYFRASKEKKMEFLSLFDSANPVECYRRSESIAPQQALAMANSTLTLAQARLLAKTISDSLDSVAAEERERQFVAEAFVRILCRQPSEAESKACLQFLAEQGNKLANAVGLTAFASGPTAAVPPASDPVQRARENLVHVLFNHNDFVTVR